MARLVQCCGAVLALAACARSKPAHGEPAPGAPIEAPSSLPTSPGTGTVDTVRAGAEPPPGPAAPDTPDDAGPPRLDAGPIAPVDAQAPDMMADLDAAPPPGAEDAHVRFLGAVDFEIMTKPTPTARYDPRHLLGVWVETADATPIRALGRWAFARNRALTTFNERFPTLMQDLTLDPDILTAATPRTHALRQLTWDLRDQGGMPVPDGDYVIWAEVVDSWEGSVLGSIAFHVGPEPLDVRVEETAEFGWMHLIYRPAAR